MRSTPRQETHASDRADAFGCGQANPAGFRRPAGTRASSLASTTGSGGKLRQPSRIQAPRDLPRQQPSNPGLLERPSTIARKGFPSAWWGQGCAFPGVLDPRSRVSRAFFAGGMQRKQPEVGQPEGKTTEAASQGRGLRPRSGPARRRAAFAALPIIPRIRTSTLYWIKRETELRGEYCLVGVDWSPIRRYPPPCLWVMTQKVQRRAVLSKDYVLC